MKQIVFLSLFLIVCTAGCKKDKQKNIDKITIAVSITPLSAPFYISKEKGFFKDEGLDVKFKEFKGGYRTLKALLKGEADICTSSDLPVMFNSFKQKDFAIIATFVTSNNDLKIITRKDASIKTGHDFKGKKIGAIFGGSSQYLLDTFLLHNKIGLKEVKKIHIPPEKMALALKMGKVDAVIPWEPFGFETVQLLGDNARLIPYLSQIYLETFNLISKKGYIASNKDALVKVLKALDRAINFLNTNETQSKKILAKSLNKPSKFISWIWKDFNYSLSLDQFLLTTLEYEARWAIKNNLVTGKRIPNYLNFINLDILKETKPEAVGIIH